MVIQAIPLTDNKVSLWFKSSIAVAGAQFDNICSGMERESVCAMVRQRKILMVMYMVESTVNGESAFVNVQTDGSGGGEGAANDMSVTGGIEGKWLIFSLSGGNIQPGYYHFTTLLLVQGLSEIGCDEGSFRLTKGVISDPAVRKGRRGIEREGGKLTEQRIESEDAMEVLWVWM